MQQVDDPPYLSVGTEVSAKYKGAFCEAKVRKVVRNIKCKIAYKQGLGSGTVSDDQIKGELLRVGATVEVKHPDRREFVEATITKIQDCSQYTVVFDDGDITTLRRSALCLKSGRHFNESETLDQLPLTHPEHFGNPVIGGRRGRRSRHMPDDSSDDDDEPSTTKQRIIEKEEHIGKVVCVENTEAKKKTSKENWFPALVVAPTAQDTVRIRVKEEYLVRSFKDGRYYTVPKKEATEFTREKTSKQDSDAVQAALEYLDNDSLPPHWDRDSLFGTGNCSSDFDGEYDSDSSDDEPREEKDHFVAQLYKYMDDRGTPLNKGPSIVNKDVDLYRLFRAVQKLGGYNRVTSQSQWKQIATRLGYTPTTTSIQNLVKQAYKKFLLPFEEFDRKLGCTMVAHPRANRIKGRSLVRANSVASPKPDQKESSKAAPSAVTTEESENTSESSTDNLKTKRKMSTGSGKVKALVEKFEEKAKDDVKDARKAVDDVKEAKDPKESKETKETRDTKKTREIKEGKDVKEIKGIKHEKEIEPNIPASTRTGSKNANTPKDEILSQATTSSIAPTPAVKKEKTIKKSQQSQEEKKGKKRKEIEAEKSEKDKTETNDFPIEVGDKLKVYYHEQKVTYEAKVIEISVQQGNPLYLVHYTGWNTRYDEWVPKERIAENLTNNKTNKRAKTGTKTDAKSNIMALETKIAQTGPTSKPTIKRVRGTSRGDSQPPRSTTPSSVASNSSRTKSPATPAQRRTTRGQPGSIRRTSNNTDISSVQTDTDTDSDEPVKKAPIRKTPLPRTIQQVTTLNTDRKINSNPSSEEESSTVATTKGRDYDLNQIRSELKGFKELKSPSPELDTETGSSEKKFSFPSTISNTESGDSVSQDITKTVTSDSKTSTDTSSESDSFGDDDSQFSDKTTTLENISEKLQEKFKAGKLDTDVFKKSLITSSNELVNKVATLKASGIEKIIKNSLADKSKALPEKMTMKTLCERSPLKQMEREKEKLKEEQALAMEMPASSSKIQSVTKILPKLEASISVSTIEKAAPIAAESIIIKPSVISSIKPAVAEKQQTKEKLVQPQQEPMDEIITKPFTTIVPEPKMQSSPCDVYEFKEPEPFEYEAPKKLSPDIDKKTKKKLLPDSIDLKVSTTLASTTPKKIKKSPVKEDKFKVLKSDEEMYSAPMTSPTTLIPPKAESIFDSLRKSPSFNLNLATQNIQEEMVGLSLYRDEKTDVQPPNIITKPTFISSFVEATPEETLKIFDMKTPSEKIPVEKSNEFETAKKVLSTDELFDIEPPKIEKPSSIADKVLKALNQQNQQQHPGELEDVKSPEIEKIIEKPVTIVPVVDAKPVVSVAAISPAATAASVATVATVTDPPLPEPPKIELPAIIKHDIDTQPKKPVLSSPEHKLDILESIAPKNNDLSETIQKLESVIQQCAEINQISEDSSDSTDSEQRLIIEDESLSSETQNEFNMTPDKKDDNYPVTLPKKEFDAVEENVTFVSNFQTGFFGVQQHKMLDKQHNIIAETSSIKTAVDLVAAYGSSPLNQTGIKVEMFEIKEQMPSDEIQIKSDEKLDNIHNESLSLLLCEETIPGSPAPSSCAKDTPETKKDYDNIFASPHPSGSDIKSIPMDIECTEIKVKRENASPNSSPRESLSHDDSSEDVRKQEHGDISPRKRRRSKKPSECETIVKRRKGSRRNTATGSDSEDNTENLSRTTTTASSTSSAIQRPSKPCQYNFLVQLDPAMNSNQRIAILNKKIQELRKTYTMIKAELASIDRRRKKLRRREREKKNQQKLQANV